MVPDSRVEPLIPTLPHSGQVSVAELFAALRQAPDVLGSGDHLDLRVVAIPDGARESWGIHAAELRLQRSSRDALEERIVQAGTIRLFRFGESLDAIESVESFWAFVRRWRPAVMGNSSDVEPQQTQSIQWFGSRGRAGETPGWRYPLYALGEGGAGFPEPPGPFLLREENYLAPSVAEASAYWLERPFPREMQSPALFTWVILNDYRAYFGEVVIQPETLSVEIKGHLPTGELTFAALFETLDGQSTQHIIHAPAQLLTVDRPAGVLTRLRLYLLSAAGECLDELHQDTMQSTRIERVAGLEQAPIIDQILADALTRGEGETIEFKSFIPLERTDSKSKELLKVVCAFANSQGGHLFIGVTNELELVGLTERLTRQGQCAPEKAKADYLQGIQRMLHEGLTPTPLVEADWLQVAGHDILHLKIERQRDQCFALVESREIFIRRGASCAKALPSDLELLLRRDSPSLLNGLRGRP